MVKADLHNHLSTRTFRGDFYTVIDVTRTRLDEGAVLGLINFGDARYERFAQSVGYERQDIGNAIYVPDEDVLVIKGQEIKTKKGHLLVLGLQKDVHLKDDRTLDDAIKEAHDNNGIIVADHPFYKEGIGPFLEENASFYLDHFDAIEVFNGEASLWLPRMLPRNANKKAERYFRNVSSIFPNLGAIATSDGHSLYEIGRSYSYIDFPDIGSAEKLVKSLRNEIRKCRYTHIRNHQESPGWGALGCADHILDLVAIIAARKLIPNFAEEQLNK